MGICILCRNQWKREFAGNETKSTNWCASATESWWFLVLYEYSVFFYNHTMTIEQIDKNHAIQFFFGWENYTKRVRFICVLCISRWNDWCEINEKGGMRKKIRCECVNWNIDLIQSAAIHYHTRCRFDLFNSRIIEYKWWTKVCVHFVTLYDCTVAFWK